MRVSFPPVRYENPIFVARPRRIALQPHKGQPQKFRGTFRAPEVAVQLSGIPNSGYGLVLRENVHEGQVITIYARNIISESVAAILKAKVTLHTHTSESRFFKA